MRDAAKTDAVQSKGSEGVGLTSRAYVVPSPCRGELHCIYIQRRLVRLQTIPQNMTQETPQLPVLRSSWKIPSQINTLVIHNPLYFHFSVPLERSSGAETLLAIGREPSTRDGKATNRLHALAFKDLPSSCWKRKNINRSPDKRLGKNLDKRRKSA